MCHFMAVGGEEFEPAGVSFGVVILGVLIVQVESQSIQADILMLKNKWRLDSRKPENGRNAIFGHLEVDDNGRPRIRLLLCRF